MQKYHNRKTTFDGIAFDSRKESARYRDLTLLQRAGKITDLRMQVPFVLIPAQYETSDGRKKCVERQVSYIADFVYTENGRTVVEDTKGVRTKDYIIKRKLMLYVHGIRVREE